MTNLHTVFGKAMTAEEYSAQWEIDSDAFSQAAIYGWMREQLGIHKLIIEVGCGTGRSTLELAKDARVICVEANAHMAAVSHEYLIANGVASSISVDLTSYSDNQVTIIVADILDPDIDELLSGVKPDAITCWLIGAEPERIALHLSKSLDSFSGGEMPKYREKVHERCYEIGKALLKPNGIVHITDRLFIRSWGERNGARQALADMHQELSGDSYDVVFDATRLERYQPSFSASKIQLMSEGSPEGAIAVFGSIKGVLKAS